MFSTQLLTLNYLLYSPTETAPQFLWQLTPFIHTESVELFCTHTIKVCCPLLYMIKVRWVFHLK